jgi:hypothetical protein
MLLEPGREAVMMEYMFTGHLSSLFPNIELILAHTAIKHSTRLTDLLPTFVNRRDVSA